MSYDTILAIGFPGFPINRTGSAQCEIQGREAVPFLTKSGLPRVSLKSVWTLVDPNHVGVLRNRGQAYTLLRFVAIGQYQIKSGMQVVLNLPILQRFMTVALPPPWFQGLGQQPQQQQGIMTGHGQPNGMMGQQGMTTGQNPSYGRPQQKIQQPLQPTPSSLAPPLPSPAPPVPTLVAPIAPVSSEDNGFGDFSAAAPSPAPTVEEDEEDFGDFGSAPTPAPMPASEPVQAAIDPLDAISFMPSSERPPELPSPSVPAPVPDPIPTPEEGEEDEFGDFGGATDPPEPQIEVAPAITMDPPTEPASPPKNELAENNTLLSFDASTFSLDTPSKPTINEIKLSPKKEEKPASPKPVMMAAPPMSENASAMGKLSVFDALAEADLGVEEEDFGDFEDHETPAPAPTAPPVPPPAVPPVPVSAPAPAPATTENADFGFGDFASAGAPTPPPEVPVVDLGMGTIASTPIPPPAAVDEVMRSEGP